MRVDHDSEIGPCGVCPCGAFLLGHQFADHAKVCPEAQPKTHSVTGLAAWAILITGLVVLAIGLRVYLS